jgi:hypothetical protein
VLSQAAPPEPGAAGLPVSIAGLPVFKAWVRVDPPLLASGPSCGLTGLAFVPVWSPTAATGKSVCDVRMSIRDMKSGRIEEISACRGSEDHLDDCHAHVMILWCNAEIY